MRRVASADGVELAVSVWGDPDAAATVVLVHGYPDTRELWRGVVAALGRSLSDRRLRRPRRRRVL